MSDTYEYNPDSKKAKVADTYGTSDDSTPFPPVSRRISIFLIIFIVTLILLGLAYAGFIAIYWAINGVTFQWIVVPDIFAAVCLLLTAFLGIVSVATYLIPIIRLIASAVVFLNSKI
jgi:hypothetical protein